MLGWLVRLFSSAPKPALARDQFARDRSDLEQAFFALAAASGKPRGLRWKSMEWSSALELARDRKTGKLVALASVIIAFEAVEAGEMEGVEAVGNLREASALFILEKGRWVATGKTLFNLAPADVLARFATQYERITS